jgi:hypothetical protein
VTDFCCELSLRRPSPVPGSKQVEPTLVEEIELVLVISDEFVKDLAEIVPFLYGSFRVSVFGNQGDLLPGEVPDFHQSRNCLIGDLMIGVLEILLHCLIGSSLSFTF